MSHFYGAIQGGRGEATRGGHKSSGYRAYAASWAGRIDVYLRHEDGLDKFSVCMNRHGQSQGWEGTIAQGILGVQPEMPTLLPMPSNEVLLAQVSDEELVAEVRRRFGIDIGLRQPNPPQDHGNYGLGRHIAAAT